MLPRFTRNLWDDRTKNLDRKRSFSSNARVICYTGVLQVNHGYVNESLED